MKSIETKRLLLRGFQPEDLEVFNAYAKKPNVGPNAGWKPHESLEESKQILDRFIKEDHIFALVLRETGQLIGSVGIHNDPVRSDMADCKMVGYVLDEAHWGHGYMTEAVNAALHYMFDEMKCRLISVQHFTFNKRSRRVVEKCGFVYEGLIRQNFKQYDGTYFDSCVYSITRREYFIQKAKQSGMTLKRPEEVSKEAYMDYINEWQESGERFIPSACGLRDMTYETWLRENILSRTMVKEGLVPATSFFLVDEADYIYGMVDIRHKLNEHLKKDGGHIGYGVRPSVRRNGCAQLILSFALEKCAWMGIKQALVTCDETNVGSARTIETNGGVLENTIDTDNVRIRRYWIKTNERD